MKINHEENTVAIVYVGPKALKRDTVTGYKPTLRFVRGEKTSVPHSVANALLDFPCFQRYTEEVSEQIKQQDDAKALEEKQRKDAKEKAKQEEFNRGDTIVSVDGEDIDLGKYNQAQLETFVEAHDLELKKGAEKVFEFGLRVRDAYREKVAEGE